MPISDRASPADSNAMAGLTTRLTAAGVLLLALAAVPAPLLPPHRVALAVQSALGVNWKTAYLLAALGLHGVFYASIGLLATFAVKRGDGWRARLARIVGLPAAALAVVVSVRSIKLGYVPVLENAIV